MTTIVQQGTLNRLRASVNFSSNSALNVTAPFLGKAGIVANPLGPAGLLLPTMTGGVTSPEPYQMYELTIHMLKTQGLANSYKSAIETLCNVGDFVVKSDSSTQSDYQISNGVIVNGTNPTFDGTNPEFVVVIHGIYYINQSMFNLA